MGVGFGETSGAECEDFLQMVHRDLLKPHFLIFHGVGTLVEHANMGALGPRAISYAYARQEL